MGVLKMESLSKDTYARSKIKELYNVLTRVAEVHGRDTTIGEVLDAIERGLKKREGQ
jgi:hypothetical protein